MSIASLEFLSDVVADLNKEFSYKFGESRQLGIDEVVDAALVLFTDGTKCSMHFLGKEVWHDKLFEGEGDWDVKKEMDFYVKANFTKWLKLTCQDYIDLIGSVKLI